MKDKYYIPEITEFSPGLEYELYNYDTKEYQKYTMTFKGEDSFYYPIVINQIRDERCRVKYLDQEDIESLEFKVSINKWNVIAAKKNIKNKKLIILIGRNTTHISFKDDVLFRGKGLKNKLELSKILNQLNI